MLGAVELLWIVLTLVVSSISLVALVQPNWIVNPFTSECFGPLTFCYTENFFDLFRAQSYRICGFQDARYIYVEYPSLTWQFVALVYTISTGLMIASAMVAIFALLLLGRDIRQKIAAAASFTQGISVFLSLVTVVTVPLLLNTDRGRAACGRDASVYYLASCQLGWSYMLSIAGTAMGAFCPYLAQHADVMLEGIDSLEEQGEDSREVVDIEEIVMDGPVVYPGDTKMALSNTSTGATMCKGSVKWENSDIT